MVAPQSEAVALPRVKRAQHPKLTSMRCPKLVERLSLKNISIRAKLGKKMM